jgi:hypothetical protein
MKELSVIEAKERNAVLAKLAGEITDLHLSACHKAKRCHDIGADAVNDARLCGQKLEEARFHVPHGGWKDWLKENCSDISYETATRYIRVSKMSHVTDLSGCASLRQAYIECGILPAPEPTPEKQDHPITASDLLRFAGFAAKITPETFSTVMLADDQKATLRERLKPAHDAYLALL